MPGFEWEATLLFGTVLDENETVSSERVMAAAGHGAAVMYHFFYENGRPIEMLPGGTEWLKAYADIPVDVRHLAIHDLHLIGVNERDKAFVTPEIISSIGGAFTASELRDRLAAMEAGGVTEVAYQPAGPDIPRELESFAKAAAG